MSKYQVGNTGLIRFGGDTETGLSNYEQTGTKGSVTV